MLPFVMAGALSAQFAGLTLPPSGNNQKGVVTQYIGPVQVTIDYSSPAVHGPDGKDRHGQIWGKLVPYGLSTTSFGNGKPDPWRAGANENTVFAVSHDVTIEGQPLPAGRYGLHMIPGEETWTVIFSKDAGAWGSFFYDASHDALRVTVKPHKSDYREWLTYDFTARHPEEATVELQWEDLAVPWNIKAVSYTHLALDTEPGVVDQQIKARLGGEARGDAVHTFDRRQIRGAGFHVDLMGAFQLRRKLLEPVAAARDEQKIVALRGQLAREHRSDAG